MLKIIARATLFFLQLLLINSAHAIAPLAGSTLNNQAKIEYFDTGAGFFNTQFSNTVKMVVQPVEKVLVAPALTIQRTVGSFASLPFTVVTQVT